MGVKLNNALTVMDGLFFPFYGNDSTLLCTSQFYTLTFSLPSGSIAHSPVSTYRVSWVYFKAAKCSIGSVQYNLFRQSFFDGHFGGFQNFTPTNNASMNNFVHTLFCPKVFGLIPRSRTLANWYICLLLFAIHKCCTDSISHNQHIRLPVPQACTSRTYNFLSLLIWYMEKVNAISL